jgi:carboxyl-terminal processing protease
MNRFRLNIARLVLASVLGLAGPQLVLAAEPTVAGEAAAAGHTRKAQLITELLSQYHYRDTRIDDALADRVMTSYLEALDQERYYFLAEDVAAFAPLRTRLDDELRRGELAGGYQVFKRYQQRVQERADFALAMLAKPLDLSQDDRLELDRAEAPWARTKAELDALWFKRIKNDALTLSMSGQEPDKVKEILTKRYQRLARTVQQYTTEEIFQTYMNAWAHVFDPHTAYLSPRLSENFDIHMRLSLEGIGAMLRSENDFTEVVELVVGGPADKSGKLQPGDRIIGVGEGDEGDIVDVVGWRLTDVVDLIRGPKESVVRLQVIGKSANAPRMVTLVRNQVQLDEQAAQAKTIEVDNGQGTARIGVITLPAFYMDFAAADAGDKNYRSTTRDVRRLLGELEKDGIDGLVIDLRGNGGGSLREATELTGLFVHGGPVVQVRRQDGGVEILQDTDEDVAYDGPLTVLVDRFSASASEIFAAAIQDYGRGVVVGQQTFGKGTVQTLVDLDRFGLQTPASAGRLKLTIAKFYRINGDSTQRNGVVPDIKLPAPALPAEIGEDAVETALPWDKIKPVPYRPEGELASIIPSLRARHEARLERNPAFQALIAEYDQLRALQAKTSVPLNAQLRRQERDQAEQMQLDVLNRRLAAYDLPPLKTLEGLDEDALPDTVLESAAAVAADLSSKRALPKTVSSWTPPRVVAQ